MTRAEARVLRGQIRAIKCDCLSCRSVSTGQCLPVSVYRSVPTGQCLPVSAYRSVSFGQCLSTANRGSVEYNE